MEPYHVDVIEDDDIVFDLSWNRQERERKNCEDCRVPNTKYQLDLNNSPEKEEYLLSPIPSEDLHVSSATHDYENDMEATFDIDKYIDWDRVTLDFMPDGRLPFYEGSNSPVHGNDQFDYRDFNLNYVMEDVQSREDDVRTTSPAAMKNDNNGDSHHEDEYIPRWLF